MVITSKKGDASCEINLQEIEMDRAKGIEVEIRLKRKYLNVRFFHLWIDKSALSTFISMLMRFHTGKSSQAVLHSPDEEDLYIIFMRKGNSLFFGIKVQVYNFTPIKLKDSATLSFEIESENILIFIDNMKSILHEF
jgi:hypothetical protein